MALNPDFLTEDEQIIREFRPHWRLLFLPVLWALLGIAAIVLAYNIPPDDSIVDLITVGVILLVLVPLAVRPVVNWWFTTYALTNERLITRTGVVARSGVEIPLENINNVLFEQNMIERMLGCGDLLVESAGETGQSRFEDIRQPDKFQALLYRTREARSKDLSGAAPAAAAHPTENLERLAKLHRDGVITDEEFAEKRQAILDQM